MSEQNKTEEYQKSHDILKKIIEADSISLDVIPKTLKSGFYYLTFKKDGTPENCYWHDSFRKILGFDDNKDFPNDFDFFLKRIHFDDFSKVNSIFTKAFKNQSASSIFDCECRIRTKTQGFNWFNFVGKTEYDVDKEIFIFSGLLININRRKHAESELKKSKLDRSFQMNVLTAIAKSYLTLHVIDLQDDTYIEYNTTENVRRLVKVTTLAHKQMIKVMSNVVVQEEIERAIKFTDLKTISERLAGKKSLSFEFNTLYYGWCRGVFIPLELTENNVPKSVIFATRVIEEEKRREEVLMLRSNTDSLTGMLNRHAYEEVVKTYTKASLPGNFIIVSMDVNGLKDVNDLLGHVAGDELLIGAAECMRKAFGRYGNLYRIGGDEFCAILAISEEELKLAIKDFKNQCSEWQGEYVDSVSVSIGYATKAGNPFIQIMEMSKIADEKMYEAKARHYARKGIDRRSQQAAFCALSKTYEKIIKVNLTTLKNEICYVSANEKEFSKKYYKDFAEMVDDFLKNKLIHEDDIENFSAAMDFDKLRKFFKAGNEIYSILYRRLIHNEYKKAIMELITANDYSDDNQNVFVCVKNIEN